MKKDVGLVDFIKTQQWEQGTRRVTTLHRFFDFSESGENASTKMFSAGMSQDVFVVKNGDISRFQVNADWNNFVKGLTRFLNKPNSISWARKHMTSDSDAFIDWLKKNCQKSSVRKLSNKQLATVLMKRHDRHQTLLAWQWFGFIGKYSISSILNERLEKYSVSEDEIKVVLFHKRPISIIEEELFAKKIAYQIQQQGLRGLALKKKISAHIKKFGHIVVYDETNDPMSFDFVQRRLEEYVKNKNLGKEIEKTQAQFKENKKKFQSLLSRYKFNKKDLDLVIFSDEFAHFMEIRNQYRAIAAVYSKDLFRLIAERINLTVEDLLCFNDYEINDALLGKIDLPRQEAKWRFTYSTVITKKQKFLISTGKEAKEIEEVVTKKYDVAEIKGSPTNKGIASGRVKIVIDMDDVRKVTEGDILVSPMTKPVFLLAMKKAAAIVTDEGGMLCHAAIISRELNIPCVVGTKIATQVLKDGDMVEVDANKGIVKIIKRAIN